MERLAHWMPEDLGGVYVWNNSPAFMLYVVKDGKTIYADKTLVGTIELCHAGVHRPRHEDHRLRSGLERARGRW